MRLDENNKEHNEKWPCIPDHPYRILIIRGSGSGKTNELLNLIKKQGDIDKNYFYVKDLIEPKYEFLTGKCTNAGIKHLNDLKAFIEFSDTMDHIYHYIDDYNPSRKIKVSVVFDEMIDDIIKNFKPSLKNYLLDAGNWIISCIYHSVLFFYSKRSQIKFYTLLNKEDL